MPFRKSGDVTAEKTGKVGGWTDVGLSARGGVAQGLAQLLGAGGDLIETGKGLTVQGVQALEERGLAPSGTVEALKLQLGKQDLGPLGVLGTGAKTAGTVAALKMGASPGQAKAVGNMVPTPTRMPTTRDVEAVTGAPKVYHEPQTRAGKYAKTVGQFAPGALMPAPSLLARVENAVVPAIASEAAGQATEGTPLEPAARVAAALAGGVGVSLLNRPGPTTRMLAENSRAASDQDILIAEALRRDAADRGITLTMPEALQQVTENGTGLGRLQRVLEGTRAGSERLGPVMAERPGQVRQAVTDFADSLAPPAPNPYVLGQQAQTSADDVLTGVRQQINANARPWYEALTTEQLPMGSPAAQQLVQNPAYVEALGRVRGNPILNGPIAHLPDNNLAVVNEVVKELDTLAQNARPNPAASTGSAQLSAAYDATRQQVDDLASAVSEPWRLARSMVASGREAFLDPAQAGPLGAISRSPKIAAQTGALFPSAPPEGAAAVTGQAIEMLPPDVAAGLVRQHLVNSLNEGTQNLQSGPNQWGGAKFSATIAGNPEQRATLMAGVEGAGGDQLDFSRLLAALDATGKRQAPGSQTAYNMEDLRRLGEAGTVGEGVKAVASGPSMFRRFGDALQSWQVERNAAELARAMLADPQRATEILLEARRRLPPGQALQELERIALTTGQSRPLELPSAP